MWKQCEPRSLLEHNVAKYKLILLFECFLAIISFVRLLQQGLGYPYCLDAIVAFIPLAVLLFSTLVLWREEHLRTFDVLQDFTFPVCCGAALPCYCAM
jgi:hypothetical protein